MFITDIRKFHEFHSWLQSYTFVLLNEWLIEGWLCNTDGCSILISGEEDAEEIPLLGSFYNHYCASMKEANIHFHKFP